MNLILNQSAHQSSADLVGSLPVERRYEGLAAPLSDFLSLSEQPGLLKQVQGMGWYLEEANLAQVSTNILDFEMTPLHTVYEEICRDAEVKVWISKINLRRRQLHFDRCSWCSGAEAAGGRLSDRRFDSPKSSAGLC